jgi:hypothetical protein
MIRDIRRAARILGHSPSSAKYMELRDYNVRTLQRRFKLACKEIIAYAVYFTRRELRTGFPPQKKMRFP